ncbi:S-formylglutathione hydrolase [Robbsia sp. Bb-Pol-6]|uniref:S-formylglutathione hydrolase n=1 Tax=Robbsia betulipollinis TaxID=2981849 RepID=A0ABT3ZLV6_9BURK|nr:S-formylglutathione hydrolase [Robbsia betulipollinis]MCY0387521.1 S-formylglutathione hydrolase [Robbsia betulipollinis]
MLELLSEHQAFGGVQRFYRHASAEIGLPMRFSVFLPNVAADAVASRGANADPVPGLFYLAGLTCTEETFPTKGGAQQHAARHGLALIAPDTSPRGAGLPGETDAWDVGVGAGFYVDATEAPWRDRYRMYSYLVNELPALVARELPVDAARLGIFGHSMGGHGALVLGLRNPDLFKSISAFAPIAAPSDCAWGRKAFGHYLGGDVRRWADYDASRLLGAGGVAPHAQPILVDQGLADAFLHDGQLLPEAFEAACAQAGQALTLRRHPGYDHGYYFVSSFMGDHIAHHAAILNARSTGV